MFTGYCKKLLRVKFLIAGLILACLSGAVYAADNTVSASAFLCEYAMTLYRQGNTDDAIHQLKNALMVDANNATARKLLKKIMQEQGLEAPLGPAKEQAAPLDKELISLRKENRSYKEQMDKAIDESLNKDKSLKALTQELASLKEGYQAELSDKQKGLEILKSNCESELSKLNGEMYSKDSLLGKYRKSKTEQIDRIEVLMRQIEAFLSTVEEPADKGAFISNEGMDSQAEQIARIEYLMRQIEEVLPKSD